VDRHRRTVLSCARCVRVLRCCCAFVTSLVGRTDLVGTAQATRLCAWTCPRRHASCLGCTQMSMSAACTSARASHVRPCVALLCLRRC
jgi:hypothetical protein